MLTNEQINVKNRINNDLDPKCFLPKARHSGLECPFCHNGSNGGRGNGLSDLKKSHRFYCWTCEKSLDVVELIQGHYKVSFFEALQIGADLLGIPYSANNTPHNKPTYTPKTPQPQERQAPKDRGNYAEGKKSPLALKEKANDKPENFAEKDGFYSKSEKTLWTKTGRNARKYLHSRGLSNNTLRDFRIGCNYTKHPSFPIIIPTSDETYTARGIYTGNYHKHGEKLHPLYCIQKDKADNPIFIVEGEINALSLYEIGENAIATGSAKNPHFVEDLLQSAYKSSVFILTLDPDETGQKAQKDLMQELQQLGVIAYDALYLNCNFYTNGSEDINDILIRDRKDLELRAFYARCTAQALEEWNKEWKKNKESNIFFPPAIDTPKNNEQGEC